MKNAYLFFKQFFLSPEIQLHAWDLFGACRQVWMAEQMNIKHCCPGNLG